MYIYLNLRYNRCKYVLDIDTVWEDQYVLKPRRYIQ